MNGLLTRKRLTTKGFILIDVVVATLIVSIALVPIAGLFLQAIMTNRLAQDYTQATDLAQKQLELLKIHPSEYWNNLSLPCTIPWQDTRNLPPPRYKVTTTGLSIADEPLVQVLVTINWQEGSKEYNLQFVTLYPTL